MSLTLNKLLSTDPPAKRYLKTPDGALHGPLSVEDLCKRAVQNRIPPGSTVSIDGAAWSPAEVIEELKMEWDAKCVDGRTAGPFNLLAIPLLVQDGTLVPGDTLVNRVSNRSVQVRDLLKPGTTVVRNKPASQGEKGAAESVPAGNSTQQELFVPPAAASQPPSPVDVGQAADNSAKLRLPGKTSGTRDLGAGSQVARLKESLANKTEEAEKLKGALDQEKLRHAETRRVSEFHGKLLKDRIKGLEAEQRDLSAHLADALRDADKLRQNDATSGTDARSREAELARHNAELEKTLKSSSAETARVKTALDQEKALHAELLRQREQEGKQLKDRIKGLEAEQRDVSVRLAAALQTVDKARQTEEAIRADAQSRGTELGRRNAELEKALNASVAETARMKEALEQEKAVHAEMRRAASEREQQAAGRVKELEAEGRSLSSRLAQSTRAVEELTRKDEALQLENRRKDEESAQRIEQLEKALGAASGDIAKLKADQDYEKALHSETRRLGVEKEKQLTGRTKELEAQAKELSAQLATTLQVSLEVRQKDEALQLENRKKDADTGQRIEQLRRSLEARVADVSRLKAELDREKALHTETCRLDGEREQQLVGRIKELEIKARDASARMTESIQLAEERKRKYEAIQKESRQKEGDAAVREEQLRKSAEAAVKVAREIQQKMEDEQSVHAQAQKEWRKKEQESAERLARMETDAGALSGILAQARIEAEKQRSQDLNLLDQGKVRETQLAQRLAQLQAEHEQSVIALDQARKKLAEKRLAPAPTADPAVSEREKRLTLSLTQMEKQVESSALLTEQTKAEAERLRRELVRTGERLSSAERESRERINELERTVQAAMQATETAKKAYEEQGRQCRRLTEENASLSSRIPGLQAENRKLAESAQAVAKELAGMRRLVDDANKALAEERKRSEAATGSAAAEREKLEARLERMRQEPAHVEKRAERRRVLAMAAAVGAVTFMVGVGIRSMIGGSIAREPAVEKISTKPPAAAGAIVATTAVQRLQVTSGTNVTGVRATAAVPTGAVGAVVSQPVAPILRWPDIAVEGAIVTRTNRSVTVVFRYGAFSSMANLRDKAKTDLSLVADQLRNKLDGFRLVVVGHTDTVPMSTNATYSGNYELGMARARAAVDHLVQECGLPAGAIVAVSAGGTPNTPYPNADAESRQKNRTVVLRLVAASDAPRVKASGR